MKSKKFFVSMLTAAIALSLALTCLLVACDVVPPEQEIVIDPALSIYSQREHIGYSASLSNMDKAMFKEYFANGAPAFVIPGLSEGENFVLQGIDYCEEKNWALLAGYVKPATEHVNSVIFVIDMSVKAKVGEGEPLLGALIKEVLLDNADGTAFTGHAGGIAVSKNTVWLSDDGKLYYFPLSSLISAPATSHIALKNSLDVPVNASYVSYSDGALYVGEFEYARDDYVTDPSHHSASDNSLTAWTVGYKLDETGKADFDPETGIKSANLKDVAVPDLAFWHCQKVQGMAMARFASGDRIVLSISYGRTNLSSLVVYDMPAAPTSTVTISGVPVPIYDLTEESMNIIAPPMLEDVAVLRSGDDNYLLLASESGSYNYHGAGSKSLYPTDFVWKYKLPE